MVWLGALSLSGFSSGSRLWLLAWGACGICGSHSWAWQETADLGLVWGLEEDLCCYLQRRLCLESKIIYLKHTGFYFIESSSGIPSFFLNKWLRRQNKKKRKSGVVDRTCSGLGTQTVVEGIGPCSGVSWLRRTGGPAWSHGRQDSDAGTSIVRQPDPGLGTDFSKNGDLCVSLQSCWKDWWAGSLSLVKNLTPGSPAGFPRAGALLLLPLRFSSNLWVGLKMYSHLYSCDVRDIQLSTWLRK